MKLAIRFLKAYGVVLGIVLIIVGLIPALRHALTEKDSQ